jgi:hypothetical protein
VSPRRQVGVLDRDCHYYQVFSELHLSKYLRTISKNTSDCRDSLTGLGIVISLLVVAGKIVEVRIRHYSNNSGCLTTGEA